MPGAELGLTRSQEQKTGNRKPESENGKRRLTIGAGVKVKGDDIAERLVALAVRVVTIVDALPDSLAGRHVAGQLLRSGTSPGANYRAACRVRSSADFLSEMGIVEEEADESMYWMELLVESGGIAADAVAAGRQEANELLAITVSSIKTARTARDRTK